MLNMVNKVNNVCNVNTKQQHNQTFRDTWNQFMKGKSFHVRIVGRHSLGK